jgi:hypothetical protein
MAGSSQRSSCSARLAVQSLVQPEDIAADGQVHASAEGLASAGDHDGAHRIVFAGALVGVDQLIRHLHGEGIELCRPVEGEREHALVDMPVEGVVGHGSDRGVKPAA